MLSTEAAGPFPPRGFATPSRVLSRLASLAIDEEPCSDLLYFLALVSRVARACTLLTKSNWEKETAGNLRKY